MKKLGKSKGNPHLFYATLFLLRLNFEVTVLIFMSWLLQVWTSKTIYALPLDYFLLTTLMHDLIISVMNFENMPLKIPPRARLF